MPRPAFIDAVRRGQEADYPLSRPSSHYGEHAQAASSRPVSPRATAEPESRPMSPLAKPASPSPARPPEDPASREEFHRTEPYAPSEAPGTAEADVRALFAMIQRPESMTVPIGGVWRPEEEEDEHQEYKRLFFDDEEEEEHGEDSEQGTRHNPTLSRNLAFRRASDITSVTNTTDRRTPVTPQTHRLVKRIFSRCQTEHSTTEDNLLTFFCWFTGEHHRLPQIHQRKCQQPGITRNKHSC